MGIFCTGADSREVPHYRALPQLFESRCYPNHHSSAGGNAELCSGDDASTRRVGGEKKAPGGTQREMQSSSAYRCSTMPTRTSPPNALKQKQFVRGRCQMCLSSPHAQVLESDVLGASGVPMPHPAGSGDRGRRRIRRARRLDSSWRLPALLRKDPLSCGNGGALLYPANDKGRNLSVGNRITKSLRILFRPIPIPTAGH